MCEWHAKHPLWYHSGSLRIGAGDEGSALLREFESAWRKYPQTMCSGCYGTAIEEVALAYAEAFARYTDGRAETIAATLLLRNLWATGKEDQGQQVVGQRTLAAAGFTETWSHPDSLDTAAHLLVSKVPPRPVTTSMERRKRAILTSFKTVYDPLPPLTCWVIPVRGEYDLYGSTTFLIGANGVVVEAAGTPERIIFSEEEKANIARRKLEGAWSSWRNYPSTHELDAGGAAIPKVLKILTSSRS